MHTYPVRLEGRLDPGLSRWQWQVKWLLVIPHYVILAFLLLAFAVLTVVAGFAIVFTGRYPRSIFAFNVGVMRWTWRVNYYTYSALGTYRYPPFTLAETDYPASLDVAYPQRLPRGVALVKWWLLAIPHYLVIGLFTSGLVWSTTELNGSGDEISQIGGGLIGILVLIAAVVLAFTGRYPQGLFDLVMGLNRWCYRVWGYAALMTDEYPPFRLDSGGSEPATTPPPPPAPTGGGHPATQPNPTRAGHDLECLLAGRFLRSAFDGVRWRDADASRIVEDTATELLVNLRRGTELQPINLSQEPEIQKVIDLVDFDELLG